MIATTGLVVLIGAIPDQGAGLPEILPDDQWLFYLRRDDKTNQLSV